MESTDTSLSASTVAMLMSSVQRERFAQGTTGAQPRPSDFHPHRLHHPQNYHQHAAECARTTAAASTEVTPMLQNGSTQGGGLNSGPCFCPPTRTAVPASLSAVAQMLLQQEQQQQQQYPDWTGTGSVSTRATTAAADTPLAERLLMSTVINYLENVFGGESDVFVWTGAAYEAFQRGDCDERDMETPLVDAVVAMTLINGGSFTALVSATTNAGFSMAEKIEGFLPQLECLQLEYLQGGTAATLMCNAVKAALEIKMRGMTALNGFTLPKPIEAAVAYLQQLIASGTTSKTLGLRGPPSFFMPDFPQQYDDHRLHHGSLLLDEQEQQKQLLPRPSDHLPGILLQSSSSHRSRVKRGTAPPRGLGGTRGTAPFEGIPFESDARGNGLIRALPEELEERLSVCLALRNASDSCNKSSSVSNSGASFTLLVNTPVCTTRQDLHRALKRFGPLVPSVVCRQETRHPRREWTATAGYSFVMFATHELAAAALQAVQAGLILVRGHVVSGSWARHDSMMARKGRCASGSVGLHNGSHNHPIGVPHEESGSFEQCKSDGHGRRNEEEEDEQEDRRRLQREEEENTSSRGTIRHRTTPAKISQLDAEGRKSMSLLLRPNEQQEPRNVG